jgi:hypothetical protein
MEDICDRPRVDKNGVGGVVCRSDLFLFGETLWSGYTWDAISSLPSFGDCSYYFLVDGRCEHILELDMCFPILDLLASCRHQSARRTPRGGEKRVYVDTTTVFEFPKYKT